MTVDRLRGLKPGEGMTYYRGAFTDDIRRSPPSYAQLLTNVQEEAVKLEKAGLIVLSKRTAHVEVVERKDGEDITQRVRISEYLAVGL